jgi:imidazolonepropionase-like amidohydrolase
MKKTVLLVAALLVCFSTIAQTSLFTNVNVFDGKTNSLQNGMSVLVEGSVISRIGKNIKAPDGATMIDGQGMTLMPGLMDMHSHLALSSSSLVALESSTWEEIGARTALVAEETLLDGFTTVRDAGGMNGKGVKKMIDLGELDGPRIFPSGGFIGATSSHSDFRFLTMRTPGIDGVNDSNLSRLGIGYVVDGPEAIMSVARRNLQMGATQLKMMGGGGVATPYDPWHSTTYTFEEMKAIVDVAKGYGTYVMAHLNQPESINMALDAGVMSVEHGFVIDEPTMKKLVDKGAYLSAQITGTSDELAKLPSLTPENLRKLKLAHGQMEAFFKLVKKYKPNQVFAVDAVLASRDNYKRQRRHEIWLFAKQFGNFEMLKAATSAAGQRLTLS